MREQKKTRRKKTAKPKELSTAEKEKRRFAFLVIIDVYREFQRTSCDGHVEPGGRIYHLVKAESPHDPFGLPIRLRDYSIEDDPKSLAVFARAVRIFAWRNKGMIEPCKKCGTKFAVFEELEASMKGQAIRYEIVVCTKCHYTRNIAPPEPIRKAVVVGPA